MTFGIIGGDQRQKELAKLLENEETKVLSFLVENGENLGKERITEAQILILPLPLSDGRGNLNTSCGSFPLEELFAAMNSGQRILAGKVTDEERRLAEKYGLQIEDYFLREELTVANAAITADCALKLGVERCGSNLKKVLVLGFGRIGKFLCHRLQKNGVEVWAAARKPEDRAWMYGYGYNWMDIRQIGEKISGFDLIFNTVPSLILNEETIKYLRCDVIDLASVPCMTSEHSCYIPARGLPGKMAARQAAEAIRNTVYHILEEQRGE